MSEKWRKMSLAAAGVFAYSPTHEDKVMKK